MELIKSNDGSMVDKICNCKKYSPGSFSKGSFQFNYLSFDNVDGGFRKSKRRNAIIDNIVDDIEISNIDISPIDDDELPFMSEVSLNIKSVNSIAKRYFSEKDIEKDIFLNLSNISTNSNTINRTNQNIDHFVSNGINLFMFNSRMGQPKYLICGFDFYKELMYNKLVHNNKYKGIDLFVSNLSSPNRMIISKPDKDGIGEGMNMAYDDKYYHIFTTSNSEKKYLFLDI